MNTNTNTNTNILNGKSASIDILTLSHILMWLCIGLIIQKQYKYVILLSIVWELFEYAICNIDIIYSFTKQYWIIPEKYWNETLENKIIDLIANLFGYSLGCYIYVNYVNYIKHKT